MLDGMNYCRGCGNLTFVGPVCPLCRNKGFGGRIGMPSETLGKGEDDTHFVVAARERAVRGAMSPACRGCAWPKLCRACGAETCHCLGECVSCAVRERADDGRALAALAGWVSVLLAVGVSLSLLGFVAWCLLRGAGR